MFSSKRGPQCHRTANAVSGNRSRQCHKILRIPRRERQMMTCNWGAQRAWTRGGWLFDRSSDFRRIAMGAALLHGRARYNGNS